MRHDVKKQKLEELDKVLWKIEQLVLNRQRFVFLEDNGLLRQQLKNPT